MRKILSAVLSAVMACTMLSMPVHAAEPTNLSDIGKEIEALAEENKDGYASFAAAVFSGNYVMSRGLFEGAAKISACLDYLPLAQGETPDSYTQAGIPALTRFSDHLYLIEGSNDFLYETATLDGKTVLEYSSMAYVQDDAVEGEFIAVMLFAIISVINLIILIAELILKLVKKQKLALENYIILAGQLAKLVLAAALIILLACMISPAVYTALCISMGLCAVICLISGMMTIIRLFAKNKLKLSQYVWRIVFALCCFFVSGFVVYFELFNFWA